jgi:hypothetical protein
MFLCMTDSYDNVLMLSSTRMKCIPSPLYLNVAPVRNQFLHREICEILSGMLSYTDNKTQESIPASCSTNLASGHDFVPLTA